MDLRRKMLLRMIKTAALSQGVTEQEWEQAVIQAELLAATMTPQEILAEIRRVVDEAGDVSDVPSRPA